MSDETTPADAERPTEPAVATEPAGGTDQAETTGTSTSRPVGLLLCVAIAGLEAVAVLAYTIGILVSGAQNPTSVAAPLVEAVIYLLFVAGIVLVARGLWQHRSWARTPFVVVQLFGLVIAYTLFEGDGDTTHLVGWAVGLVSVAGLVSVFLPRTAAALDQ